jgi:glycosyltransferase involved in cell wall biosynthesis
MEAAAECSSCTIRLLYALAFAVSYRLAVIQQALFLYIGLLFARSDLIVLSQDGNHDGLLYACVLQRIGRPYVLIAQKAADLYWPLDRRRDRLRAFYAAVRACFFVSEHNRRLTEEQIGADLRRASMVRNPFAVPWEPRGDWPGDRDGIRLACIGRLYPMEKGQDLLIRVLAREKWRRRPLSVTFYGVGTHREGLEEMARYHGLKSVAFAGFVDDVPSIWNDHHGLILPSRCEGLPLVEAMLRGRVSIVTDVAGNGEVLDDGRTGFLAAAPTEDTLDEVMERAWQRRAEWQAIGAAAARRIRTLVPSDPGAVMACTIERLALQQEPERVEAEAAVGEEEIVGG